MSKDEVVFFGKTYKVDALEEAMRECASDSGPPLGLEIHPAVVFAYALGDLFALDCYGEGATSQEAVKELERQVLKHFRKIGKAIGYVVG